MMCKQLIKFNGQTKLAFLSVLILTLTAIVQGDVKSTTGVSSFDSNYDGQAEMSLTSTGLAIGNNLSPSANLHVGGNALVTGVATVGSSSAGSSNLNIVGSFGMGVQNVSSNVLLGDYSLVLANTSTGNLTLELPPAGNVSGRLYTIKKTVLANTVLIAGGPFDSLPELSLSSTTGLPYVSLMSMSGNWHILSLSGNGAQMGAGNLVCWLKLDETSGTTANDSSGYGNHGTLVNGFTFSANSATGVIGGGLSLDGTNDYLHCGDGASLNLTGDLTLSCWVKPTVSSNNQKDYAALMSKAGGGAVGNVGVGGYALLVHAGNTIYGITGGHNAYSASGPFLLAETWYHIAYTHSSITGRILYINGIESVKNTSHLAVPQVASSGNNFQVGRYRNNNAQYFNGVFDEVRVYNKCLSPSEIHALYLLEL